MISIVPAIFGGTGYWEIIVILAIALLIFGHKLPSVARDVGRSLSSFKRGLRDVKDDVESEIEASNDKNEKHTESEASKDNGNESNSKDDATSSGSESNN